MSKFLKILLVCVICCQFGFIGAVGLGGGTGGDIVPVARTTGLQTNMVELARFDALWDAAGQTGDIDTDRDRLRIEADRALTFDYTLTAGDWAVNGGRCEPVTQDPSDLDYEFREASTDILALAMYGAMLDLESGAGSGNTYFDEARTQLLAFAAMTGFDESNISGSNQCILDLGTAVPNVLEAAWLLEDAGYAPWTEADRLTLAQWGRDEVFYLVSWGVQSRKNNWGIVTFNAALAIAAYGQGLDGFDNVTEWPGGVSQIHTPTQYLNLAGSRLNAWLDNSGNPMDSANAGARCFYQGQPFGLQPYGGFPDDLRRVAGGSSNTDNCGQQDLSFLCGDGQTECYASTANAKSYQNKSTNGLAHTCEILRRIDGNGARCFDLTSHDSDPSTRQSLYDAILFSTTQLTAPGETTAGIFQDYGVHRNNQGYKYVASTYYDDICMYNAFSESTSFVNVRGGRDYPYTRITHREGVAHASTLTTSPSWDCATWDDVDVNWGD